MKFKYFILGLVIYLVSFSLPVSAAESVWNINTVPYEGNLNITVYHSPSCHCCGGWINHLNQHGFQIKDIKTADVEVVKKQKNLPEQLASCHTALIDEYIIEGHVPANDIKRLLKQKPKLAGLSVPQMPVGTPGMDMDEKKEPFEVVSFDRNGTLAVFTEYKTY